MIGIHAMVAYAHAQRDGMDMDDWGPDPAPPNWTELCYELPRVRDALHGVHDFSKYNFRTIGAAELLDDTRRGPDHNATTAVPTE